MVETIHDFILGSREIIEGKMMELGGYGYAGESSSYYDCDGMDYASEAFINSVGVYEYSPENYMCELMDNVDVSLAYESVVRAENHYYDYMVNYTTFAMEGETSAENTKVSIFTKFKNRIIGWLESLFKKANHAANKHKSEKHPKRARVYYKAFATVFLQTFE